MNLYLDHLDGAGLLEDPGELRAIDGEWQVADKDLEVLGVLGLGVASALALATSAPSRPMSVTSRS